MNIVKLKEIPSRTDEINVFGGINDTFYIPEGYFKDMKNMSSDYYPAMGPRKQRVTYLGSSNINGMLMLNNNLYIAAGTSLYKNNFKVSGISLTDNKKQMLAYGAYIVILPDKVIYNTEAEEGEEPVQTINLSMEAVQKENPEARYAWAMNDSYLYISDENGNAYVDCQNGGHMTDKTVSSRLQSVGAPTGSTNMPFGTTAGSVQSYINSDERDYTGNVYLMSWSAESDNVALEKYYPSTNSFMTIEVFTTLFITASSAAEASNIAASIKQGDYLQIVLEDNNGKKLSEKDFDTNNWELVEKLKNGVYVQSIRNPASSKYLSITMKGLDILNWMKKTGYMQEAYTTADDKTKTAISQVTPLAKFPFTSSNKLVIKKEMPDMDYITVSNNRIWGCSSEKHEIYACKLGDPTNWNTYSGLASDAYAVTIGSDGPFTGAFTYKGEPYFFKENMIIRMYGTKPSNYQVDEIYSLGIEEGSSDSIVYLDGCLYYKARNGIVRFDGSSVSLVSEELGNKSFTDAVAGADYKKYYVSMKENGENAMYVYDVSRRLWHKEDSLYPNSYVNVKGTVFAISGKNMTKVNNGNYSIVHSWQPNTFIKRNTIEIPPITYKPDDEGAMHKVYNKGLEWSAETGPFERFTIEHKYIQKLGMRYEIEENAQMEVSVRYDNDENWESIYSHIGQKGEGTISITFRPRRCEKFRLRFSGEGQVYVYAVQLTVNEGSDKRHGSV